MAPFSASAKFRFWLRRKLRPAGFGILRRTAPVSSDWGFDRGNPVDRYYISKFLNEHRNDIRGRVLEVKDSEYTRRLGSGVTHSDVLDIDTSNPDATLIADLSNAANIPSAAFDCFILTQTLQLIFDTRSCIENARRLLRSNGVLLVTVPSVSKVALDSGDDFWRFTQASCARLFGEEFGAENVTVTSFGNVLSCCAFLQGLAFEELSERQLSKYDELFPLLIGIRAVKRP